MERSLLGCSGSLVKKKQNMKQEALQDSAHQEKPYFRHLSGFSGAVDLYQTWQQQMCVPLKVIFMTHMPNQQEHSVLLPTVETGLISKYIGLFVHALHEVFTGVTGVTEETVKSPMTERSSIKHIAKSSPVHLQQHGVITSEPCYHQVKAGNCPKLFSSGKNPPEELPPVLGPQHQKDMELLK